MVRRTVFTWLMIGFTTVSMLYWAVYVTLYNDVLGFLLSGIIITNILVSGFFLYHIYNVTKFVFLATHISFGYDILTILISAFIRVSQILDVYSKSNIGRHGWTLITGVMKESIFLIVLQGLLWARLFTHLIHAKKNKWMKFK